MYSSIIRLAEKELKELFATVNNGSLTIKLPEGVQKLSIHSIDGKLHYTNSVINGSIISISKAKVPAHTIIIKAELRDDVIVKQVVY